MVVGSKDARNGVERMTTLDYPPDVLAAFADLAAHPDPLKLAVCVALFAAVAASFAAGAWRDRSRPVALGAVALAGAAGFVLGFFVRGMR